MAFNVGDSVVARDGVMGQVVSKYFGTIPSEVSRELGFWEASNFNQIPQWYLNPSLSLDAERNQGKATEAYTAAINPAFSPWSPDWSKGRELANGTPHDGVPYTMYGVGRLEVEYNFRGNVSLFANNGAGGTRVTVGAGHGLVDGNVVLVYDTTNYDGFFTIFNTAATTFDIARVFVATEPGKWATPTSEGRGVMEEISEETITGFQVQRAPAIDTSGAVVTNGKLNHPFIP
jgi:hypothetical protein